MKTIGGSVVNTAGVALVSKTVTLRNDDTGAVLTTTTTNADGEWEFANRDETIRYRADAAFGGSSSQVVVRKPASAEFDHLYANLSFRTAAGATVALGGPLTVAGALTVVGGITAGGGITGDLAVGGDVTLGGDLHADNLFGASATLSGTLTVAGASTFNNTVSMTSWLEVAGAITTQDDLQVFGTSTLDGAVSMAGGAFTIDAAGVMAQSSNASFNSAVSIPNGPLHVPGGTLAAPGIATVGDPDTGIWLPGSNDLMVVTNGLQVARAWKNGVNTQFSVNGNEFSIGTTKLLLNATIMTAASSATGVVRKIQICDSTGAAVGWLAVYGAVG